jgi:hypothetical protein
MDDWFPTPEQVERAMKGGCRVPSTRHTFARELIALLVERGWSRSSVSHMFRSLDDRYVGTHRASLFVEEWAKFRASRTYSRCLQATLASPVSVPLEYPISLHRFSSRTSTTFASILREIGIRPSIVAILERRIYAPLVDTCYTEPQLVDAAIEYLLRRRVPITKPDPLALTTHPFRPTVVQTWFSPPEGTFPERSLTPAMTLFQNIPFRCSQELEPILAAALRSLPTHNPATHILHFHTTSWGGATRILKTAISHAYGRPCLDFGLEPVFYLSQKIRDALGWGFSLGQSRAENEVAILVFSLPRATPPLRFKHLQGEEWVSLTGESRRCIRPNGHEANDYYELPEIENYDYVYGHMVANAFDVHKYGVEPVSHDPPKTQLASKTTQGDMFLHAHLAGCLFFQKHIPPMSNRRFRSKSYVANGRLRRPFIR